MEQVKSNNYKDISTILQSLESKLFLEMVGKAFSKKFPEAPIFTVHDTMITLKKLEVQLAAVIKDTYHENFGFSPQTKPTYLIPNTAFDNIEKYTKKKLANV